MIWTGNTSGAYIVAERYTVLLGDHCSTWSKNDLVNELLILISAVTKFLFEYCGKRISLASKMHTVYTKKYGNPKQRSEKNVQYLQQLLSN